MIDLHWDIPGTTGRQKVALITGTSGFIGSHALEYYLSATNWRFICPNSWQHKGTPERITRIFEAHPEWKRRVRVVTHDLVSPFTDHTIKSLMGVDYIINFASESHVNRSIEEPVPFIQNNVNLVLNMLELARKIKPSHFFQVSTDEVYGTAPDGVRFEEWSSILPSNPYAASKAAQEAIAISYWRTYGVPLIITNTVNNFGFTQDKEKYLARLVSKISKGEKVTVHGNDEYIGGRFYLGVKNHADAILHIINNVPVEMYEEGKIYPNRFNVTSDDEVNNLEMAKIIARLMGKELDYELIDYHQDRPGHDRRYGLSGEKIKATGWVMPFGLEECLKEYIKTTLANPEWL